MLEGIIEAALASAPPEMKAGLKKVKEFMPIITAYHSAIPLDRNKGELGVSYMLRFEETGIVLYQVILASLDTVANGKPFVSRQLSKWNISEKIDELTKGL